MSGKQLHDFTLILIKTLDRSIIVKETPGSESFVLPLSQIEFVPSKKQGHVEVTMPEWLAIEKELF